MGEGRVVPRRNKQHPLDRGFCQRAGLPEMDAVLGRVTVTAVVVVDYNARSYVR